MHITITGKHLEVRAGMRTHIEQHLAKLDKYYEQLREAHVLLTTEKYLYVAEVTLRGKSTDLFAAAHSKGNLYVAIDAAIEKLEAQLRKQAEKSKAHAHRGKVVRFRAEERAPQGGVQPQVIRTETFAAKPMVLDEACLQLGIGRKEFLVFTNAETARINVLYKRKDGNYGLVEPEY